MVSVKKEKIMNKIRLIGPRATPSEYIVQGGRGHQIKTRPGLTFEVLVQRINDNAKYLHHQTKAKNNAKPKERLIAPRLL